MTIRCTGAIVSPFAESWTAVPSKSRVVEPHIFGVHSYGCNGPPHFARRWATFVPCGGRQDHELLVAQSRYRVHPECAPRRDCAGHGADAHDEANHADEGYGIVERHAIKKVPRFRKNERPMQHSGHACGSG